MVCPADKTELSKGMAAQLAADEAQELPALEAAHVSTRDINTRFQQDQCAWQIDRLQGFLQLPSCSAAHPRLLLYECTVKHVHT
jgi:hypothetical protein